MYFFQIFLSYQTFAIVIFALIYNFAKLCLAHENIEVVKSMKDMANHNIM